MFLNLMISEKFHCKTSHTFSCKCPNDCRHFLKEWVSNLFLLGLQVPSPCKQGSPHVKRDPIWLFTLVHNSHWASNIHLNQWGCFWFLTHVNMIIKELCTKARLFCYIHIHGSVTVRYCRSEINWWTEVAQMPDVLKAEQYFLLSLLDSADQSDSNGF